MERKIRGHRFMSAALALFAGGFFRSVNGLYPESFSGMKIGGSSPRRLTRGGMFGASKKTSLRSFVRRMKRYEAEKRTFDHIRGKAAFWSRPLGRISPYVTSSMIREGKRMAHASKKAGGKE